MALTAALLTLNGCMTAIVSSTPVSSSKHVRTYILEDEVIAVATAKEATGEGNSGDIVLVGKSNSYHLVRGNEEIKTLMELDASAIKINNEQPIELKLSDDKFDGYIQVTYTKSDYSNEEVSKLTLDGFRKLVGAKNSSPYYSKSVLIIGTVYAKYDSVPPSAISKSRKIKFYTEKFEKTVNTDKAIKKAMELPIAIIFDVITAPIQAILLVGAVASTAPKQ
jgi:hypothetical protein